eukprot:555071-Pleurochrysis_carterae.AAC.3
MHNGDSTRHFHPRTQDNDCGSASMAGACCRLVLDLCVHASPPERSDKLLGAGLTEQHSGLL